ISEVGNPLCKDYLSWVMGGCSGRFVRSLAWSRFVARNLGHPGARLIQSSFRNADQLSKDFFFRNACCLRQFASCSGDLGQRWLLVWNRLFMWESEWSQG